MDGGDPRRMLKCSAGVQDKTIINRIMLRFRPIAPKPVTGDSVSSETMFSNKNLLLPTKRAKRKYVRVCKNNNRSSRKRRILGEAKEDEDAKKKKKNCITLQLMPEKSDLEKPMVVDGSLGVDLDPTVGDYNNNYHFHHQPTQKIMVTDNHTADHAAVKRRIPVVVMSWMMVESVTETCMDGGEVANCTDVEKMKILEKDNSPCFISDESNGVIWVNQAYKSMVAAVAADQNEFNGEPANTAVGLVLKESFMLPYGAFSCRVRLLYGSDEKGKKRSKMVPCDVWRMSAGGFAWRLDVKAALSLGL